MRGIICIGGALAALAVGLAACGEGDATAKGKDLDLTRLAVADDNVRTSGAKRGYLYLCRDQMGGGGAQQDGPWIDGDRWDYTRKAMVDGDVEWREAVFSQAVSGSTRTLRGNGLPTNHTTGTYPVSSSDDAYQYDRNPNSIRAGSVDLQLPKNPKKLSSAQCIQGGQVGILDSGVAMFSAVDATGRDAGAHEVQDRCDGHPQIQGTYHYHALPRCIATGSSKAHSKRIGWALDGFPIYGPRGTGGEYMRNSELDACHGHTHTVKIDGRKRSTYHYHATMEFPYTVGCFRGKQMATDRMP
ncbi:MAG TPA: YHYH protein [Thermoleophilaceae bacterium]